MSNFISMLQMTCVVDRISLFIARLHEIWSSRFMELTWWHSEGLSISVWCCPKSRGEEKRAAPPIGKSSMERYIYVLQLLIWTMTVLQTALAQKLIHGLFAQKHFVYPPLSLRSDAIFGGLSEHNPRMSKQRGNEGGNSPWTFDFAARMRQWIS